MAVLWSLFSLLRFKVASRCCQKTSKEEIHSHLSLREATIKQWPRRHWPSHTSQAPGGLVLACNCRREGTERKSCNWKKMQLLIYTQCKSLQFTLCLYFPPPAMTMLLPETVDLQGNKAGAQKSLQFVFAPPKMYLGTAWEEFGSLLWGEISLSVMANSEWKAPPLGPHFPLAPN